MERMSPPEALLVLAGLSAFPSVMFLLLCRGLERMQRTAMMGTLTHKYGVELQEITLQDAVESLLGPERSDAASQSPPEMRF